LQKCLETLLDSLDYLSGQFGKTTTAQNALHRSAIVKIQGLASPDIGTFCEVENILTKLSYLLIDAGKN